VWNVLRASFETANWNGEDQTADQSLAFRPKTRIYQEEWKIDIQSDRVQRLVLPPSYKQLPDPVRAMVPKRRLLKREAILLHAFLRESPRL
jgi:hypothetical protein